MPQGVHVDDPDVDSPLNGERGQQDDDQVGAPRASWHECSCHGTAARSSAPHQPNLPTGTIGGVYRRHRDLLREHVEARGQKKHGTG